MLRVLSQTLLGLILLAAGGYLSFVFLKGLADSSGTWAIFCAIPILVSAIFLLLRAGKSDATVMKKTKIPQLGENQDTESEGFSKQIEKHNEMLEEWDQTNEKRDRLHMLSLSEDADKPIN